MFVNILFISKDCYGYIDTDVYRVWMGWGYGKLEIGF